MDLNSIFLIVQIGIIPSILSIIKYLYKERSYILLYIYIIISYLTEIITNRLLYTKYYQSAIVISKLYMLFEFVRILLHPEIWGGGQNKKRPILVSEGTLYGSET